MRRFFRLREEYDGRCPPKWAEVYITGDFGHHDGIDAVDQGLNVIDAGHYGIEHIFIGQMAEELKERFPEMEICTEPIRHPFLMV